jgi:phosphatidylinositol-3-phosphatase
MRARTVMPNRIHFLVVHLLLVIAALWASAAHAQTAKPLSRIRHIFVVVLENKSYRETFSPDSPAPYLSSVLTKQGVLLKNYYGIGHASLDNYIAMISGQPPNEDTQRDCPVVSEFVPSTPMRDAGGVIVGRGCLYPPNVPTLADQLERKNLTWRAYMEDMGKDPLRERDTCGHAIAGSQDKLLTATKSDEYADKHNPFVYFHSIIDDQPRCDGHVVNLDKLQVDLGTVASTPNFVFITPNLCEDGHDQPCVDGRPGGLVSSDQFLRTWIPRILNSPAYRADGLIVVTFDEADSGGATDSAACCGEVGMPGARFPPGMNGPGGGTIGAVLISPFIQGGTVSPGPYNHYSLLRSIEDIFRLPHLGLAKPGSVRSFGPDVIPPTRK